MTAVTESARLRRLEVGTEPPYHVVVGAGALAELPTVIASTLGRPTGVVVVADDTVARLHGEAVLGLLRAAGHEPRLHVVASGEGAKSLQEYGATLDALAGARLDRGGLVIALGGGVVGDLAGFAAATYLRGVPYLQVPTTLLAMVDSSVGGKTGINLGVGKNLVGAFWQPLAVVADLDLLDDLPRRVLRHGAVELYKAGLLGDPSIVAAFEATARFGEVVESGGERLADLLARGIAVKARVVRSDPRESGARALLNLGHTVGHALESLAAGGLAHGAAVAYGLVAAAAIGEARGMLDWRDRARSLCSWVADEPPPAVPAEAVLDRIARDKKFVGSRRRFILLEDVGRPVMVDDVRDDELRLALAAVREVAP